MIKFFYVYFFLRFKKKKIKTNLILFFFWNFAQFFQTFLKTFLTITWSLAELQILFFWLNTKYAKKDHIRSFFRLKTKALKKERIKTSAFCVFFNLALLLNLKKLKEIKTFFLNFVKS
jgi:hypothetical protein